MTEAIVAPATEDRERDFWDHHVPSLEECLREYRAGPGPFERAMLDAVAPRPGMRVLDFACGAGVTTAWLADRGAEVVGIDLSPVSIERAEKLRAELGLSYELRVGDVDALESGADGGFDGIVGRFALHHLDLEVYGPALAALLRPRGRAAFVETMATNPLLRVARRRLPGRLGITKYGTNDEHPLTHGDLDRMRSTFGGLEVHVPSVVFFLLLERHVLKGRRPGLTRWLYRADQALGRRDRLKRLSYWQVVVLEKA